MSTPFSHSATSQVMVYNLLLFLGIILAQAESRYIRSNDSFYHISFVKEVSVPNEPTTPQDHESNRSLHNSLTRRLNDTEPVLSIKNETTAKWFDFTLTGSQGGSAGDQKETNGPRSPPDMNLGPQSSFGVSSDTDEDTPSSSPEMFINSAEANNTKALISTGLHCSVFFSLSTIVDLSYDTHVQLIYRGVPANIVKHFYNEALRHLLKSACLCQGRRFQISLSCVQVTFWQDVSGRKTLLLSRRLRDILIRDELREVQVQKFPVYHRLAATPLPELSIAQQNITHLTKQETLKNAVKSDSGQFTDDFVPRGVFPETAQLFHSDKKLDPRCSFYNGGNTGLPARLYVAYALGLGLHVHFSFVDNERASELIDDACFRAYLIAKCEKQSERLSIVPYFILENQAKRIRNLLDEHGYEHDPEAPFVTGSSMFARSSNVSEVIRVGFHFFRREIDYLSSMEAHGRPIVLDTVEHSIYMRDMRAVLSSDISMSSFQLVHNFVRGSEDANDGISGVTSDATIRCPEGWKYVQRLTPIDDVYEFCCSPQCSSLDHTLMSFMVQRESCCDKCNYFRCATTMDERVEGDDANDSEPKYRLSDGGVAPLASSADERSRPATLVNI